MTPPPSEDDRPKTILIGLSGPSSSGKTTLARLMRSIFNVAVSSVAVDKARDDGSPPTTTDEGPEWKLSLFILHQDDFYKTDKDVPVISVTSPEHGTRDLQDWDCVESLDLPLFEHTLTHVRDHGSLPPDTVSKEDQNSVGASGVSESEVERLRAEVEDWFRQLVQESSDTSEKAKAKAREIKICILDGFLLYPPPQPDPATSAGAAASGASSTSRPQNPTSTSTPPISTIEPSRAEQLTHLSTLAHTLLSPRLFLASTRAQTLARRLARSGYVTLEGFWTDPPGYVEDVVWPNYARDHAWMYRGGDVDAGVFDDERCRDEHVLVCPGQGNWEMDRCLGWGVERLKGAVEERLRRE